jgi:hypothetical protein
MTNDNEKWKTQEFTHAGYRCVLTMNPIAGIPCGYVGVPKYHPWARDDAELLCIGVHGGVTYLGKAPIRADIEGGDGLFWVGFDMGHVGDYNFALLGALMHADLGMQGAALMEFDDARRETEGLAEQAREAAVRA